MSLDGIRRICEGFDAHGNSAELVRAVAIERFDQLEPVSAAVN